MKKILGLIGALSLLANVAYANTPETNQQTTQQVEKNTSGNIVKSSTPAITIGLPLNTSGISIANRPDVLNFATINIDNTISINWKNVCSLTTSHKLNLQTDLSNYKGNVEIYLLPYILESSNPEQCKK